MTIDSQQLVDLWTAAAARPIVSAFRTAALDVDTAQGRLLVGVDVHGHRHLLVPLAAKHTLTEDVEGRAVVLRKRTLEDADTRRSYASLELVEPRMSDLFTALCVEVVERISTKPTRAVAALRKVLDDWRALLSGARELLSASALAGLFGELDLLRRMLDRDAGAVAFWTGPTGSAQDFHRGADALEVKTTRSPEGRSVQIHGIDQLDVAPPGQLLLHWSRLRTDHGSSVPDLVDGILDRTDDPIAFRKLLHGLGYQDSNRDVYGRHRFAVVESRTYQVGPGFPRITAAGLTGDAVVAGVGPVDYVVDLDSAAADALRITADPVEAFLGAP